MASRHTPEIIDQCLKFRTWLASVRGSSLRGDPSHHEAQELMYRVCTNAGLWDWRGNTLGRARFPSFHCVGRTRRSDAVVFTLRDDCSTVSSSHVFLRHLRAGGKQPCGSGLTGLVRLFSTGRHSGRIFHPGRNRIGRQVKRCRA